MGDEGALSRPFHASLSANVWPRRVSHLLGLTVRESEVLALMARGRNAAYISETLVISENTAKTHGKHIYRKMGASSQQQLMDVVEARMALDDRD